MSTKSTATNVREYVRQCPDVQCRKGHRWIEITTFGNFIIEQWGAVRAYTQHDRCDNCHMLRKRGYAKTNPGSNRLSTYLGLRYDDIPDNYHVTGFRVNLEDVAEYELALFAEAMQPKRNRARSNLKVAK